MQRSAFSKAERFQETFTTATGLQGIDTERTATLRQLLKPKPKPINPTARLASFRWSATAANLSADFSEWLTGNLTFPKSGATMNCIEAVVVDFVAVARTCTKSQVSIATAAAVRRNKPLRAVSGLLDVLGFEDVTSLTVTTGARVTITQTSSSIVDDDVVYTETPITLQRGDVLFFMESRTEIAHVIKYVSYDETTGVHTVRSHWTHPQQGYRVVDLAELMTRPALRDAAVSFSSVFRAT